MGIKFERITRENIRYCATLHDRRTISGQRLRQKRHESRNRNAIRLSVWPENSGAFEFYKKIGFIETEEWLEDERVMDYFINNN